MPEWSPNAGDQDATQLPDVESGAREPSVARSAGAIATERTGDQIGPYKLLSLIGEGGFGTVWLAERREPFVQRVALKLIKAGMDSKSVLARFEQERQALAVMNHPNIARVLDGGITPAGRPYFAMEFVKGEPITEFCDARKRDVKARLKLFQQACEAVQHAHLKQIVHRDLKPSNILAFEQDGKEPTLKVIDFGVAKAMSQRMTEHTIFTETGQMIGTPEYMSPEQANPTASDIDTRSDIYSLGVLLYELVTGSPPFDSKTLRARGYAEIQRIIREEDPPSPSARLSTISAKDAELKSRIEQSRGITLRDLASQLKSELEWIPLKAMRKEPQHRYQTAQAFAEDVRNYLENKPLVAAPESTAYRVRKYVRRNKALVTGVAAVALALVTGLSLATWQWRVAVAQRAEAEQARDAERARASELKQVSDFQSKALSQIDTTTAGEELFKDIRQRLSAALEKSGIQNEERAARQIAFERELARVNATDAAANLIDFTILGPAVKAIDMEFREQPIVDAQLRSSLGVLYQNIGRYEPAFLLLTRALESFRRVHGEEHLDTLSSINNMGRLLQAQGKLAEAEPYFREALKKSRLVLGEEHPNTLGSLSNMGALLQAQGNLVEAELCFKEALDKSSRLLGEEHPNTLISINNMGFLLQVQGKFAEAEPYYREALEKRRRTLGEEHPDTLNSINSMGFLLQAQGKRAAAEPYFQEALEKRRRVLGEEHPSTLNSLNNMGFLLYSQRKFAQAEPLYQEALEKRRRVLGEEHPSTLNTTKNMGDLLQAQGKHQEVIDLLSPAEPAFRLAFSGDNARVLGIVLSTLGTSRVALGFDADRFALAESNLLEAHAIFLKLKGHGANHKGTLACVQQLVRLYGVWDGAAPGGGYDAKMAQWQAKLQVGNAVAPVAPPAP